MSDSEEKLQGFYISDADERALRSQGLLDLFRQTAGELSPGIDSARAARYSVAVGLTGYGGGIPDELNEQWLAEESQHEAACMLAKEWILSELLPLLKGASLSGRTVPGESGKAGNASPASAPWTRRIIT